MRRELQGAVVVITAASSGIGRAAAYRFAEHGARLGPEEIAEIARRLRNAAGYGRMTDRSRG